jgi:hypothetical protein
MHERAAQWLWLQARSASGVPIWWDGWRLRAEGRTEPQSTWARYGEDNAGRWKASDGRGVERPAGARAVGGRWEAADHDTGRTFEACQSGRGDPAGRWEKGAPDGRDPQPARNGQRGIWRMGKTEGRRSDQAFRQKGEKHADPSWRMGEEVTKSRRGTRTISEKGTAAGRTGGMVFPGTIADRVEAIARAFAGLEVEVHHGQAREILPQPGEVEGHVYPASAPRTWVYLDPPYEKCTGYGWHCPRAEVLVLAQRWADAGAVVAVSEAEPLQLAGWHHLDLTRAGGKPEWLTLSRAPARRPKRQAALFGGMP